MVLRISGWGGLGELGLGLGSWVRFEQMQAQFPEPRASLSLQHANTTGATLKNALSGGDEQANTGRPGLRCEVSSRIGFLW